MFFKLCFIATLIAIPSVKPQNSIESLCRVCGDFLNEYCCQYYNSCCEYVNPSGCPPPGSPDTRIACAFPMRCSNDVDCPRSRSCCRTTQCGSTCIETPQNSTFSGYKY